MRRLSVSVGMLAVGCVLASTQAAPSAGLIAHAESADPFSTGAFANETVGGWTQLSSGGLTTDKVPDILPLSGGGIQVVWSQDEGPDAASIRTRIVNADGTVDTPSATVVDGWQDIVDDPQIIKYGTERLVAFTGVHSADSLDPLNGGEMFYSTSADSDTWALGPGSLSASTRVDDSTGVAAVDDQGTPLVGWTYNRPQLHRGVDAARPATVADWSGHRSPASSHISLTRDTESGTVWAAWMGNDHWAILNGALAQPIYPTVGQKYLGPDSGGPEDFVDPGQGVALASRVGGGVYAAYLVGYPKASAINIWRLGPGYRTLQVTTTSATRVVLAPGPGGRLWLAWYDDATGLIHYTRTNKAANVIGPIRTVGPPGAAGSQVSAMAATGRTGPLRLVVNASDGVAEPQMWSGEVLAVMRVKATPHVLGEGAVKVMVSDVADPVVGATVAFGRRMAETDRDGVALFKIGRAYPSGTVEITVTKDGYTTRTATVTIN